MLNYKTISAKRTINVIKNNEKIEMLDLLTKSTDTTLDLAKQKCQVIMVSKDYIGRPDLIALAVYGDDRYGDAICKVNGISNPFELNENMFLTCPSPSVCDELLLGTADISDVLQVGESDVIEYINNTSNETMLNKTNKATISKETSVVKKKKNERRSPGEQTVNDVNYVIDKSLGVVIY